jgi:CarD family transcriptional regulator
MPSSRKTGKSRKASASSGTGGERGETRTRTARSAARTSAEAVAKKRVSKSAAESKVSAESKSARSRSSGSKKTERAKSARSRAARSTARGSAAEAANAAKSKNAAKAAAPEAARARARASSAKTSAVKRGGGKESVGKIAAVEKGTKAVASRSALTSATHRAKTTRAQRASSRPSSVDAIQKPTTTTAELGAKKEISRTKLTAQEGATAKLENPVAASAPEVHVAPSPPVADKETPTKARDTTTTPSTPASSESIPVAKTTPGKAINAKTQPSPKAEAQTPVSAPALPPKAIVAARTASAPAKPTSVAKSKAPGNKHGFKLNEFIVYPAHGVGQIVRIEVQEVAGFSLELFVVSFIKDKMILKVPTSKIAAVGMRKLAEADVVDKALATLSGRARVKRTMWSRRAQEYEAKINSGDLVAIAEVVRDLYRSDTQPEQSYSERQLYEAALDRMAREVAAVRKLIESESLKLIESYLLKGPRRGQKAEAEAGDDTGDGDDDDDVDRAA